MSTNKSSNEQQSPSILKKSDGNLTDEEGQKTQMQSKELPSRKRGRPPKRLSIQVPVSPPSSRLTGISDWRFLTKEQILQIMETLPEGLALHDVLRRPRTLQGEVPLLLERQVRLSDTGLTEDLSCPICMSIYQNVAVVKDCLHRFCEKCIEKWLRTGHQVCPKCRQRIPSRRSLRADPIFQRIVQRLFPDVTSFERMNDKAVAAINERKTGLSESVFYREDYQGKIDGRSSKRLMRRETQQPSSSTVEVILVPDENQPELLRLQNVHLKPPKILSLQQLGIMISVTGGLRSDTQFELRESKDAGSPLAMSEKLGNLLSSGDVSNDSSAITLYVRLCAPGKSLESGNKSELSEEDANVSEEKDKGEKGKEEEDKESTGVSDRQSRGSTVKSRKRRRR